MAMMPAKSQAQLAEDRKAREDRAYELAGERERHHPGEKPLVAKARSLHYCVRTGKAEDAFGHALDLARDLFEYGCRTPLVSDMEYEPGDPPICHAARLLDALERIDEDTEPAISLGYVRTLVLLRKLFNVEIGARVALRDGIKDALRRAEEVQKPRSADRFDEL